MSPVVVGLLALGIVAVVLVRSIVVSARSGTAAVDSESGASDAWLALASDTAREGRQLVRELEPQIRATEPVADRSADVRRRLDGLTHGLAELASTAPTPMDARVCRGVAVTSRTLGVALGGGDDTLHPVAPVGEVRSDVVDRYTDFVKAVGDLERHVALL